MTRIDIVVRKIDLGCGKKKWPGAIGLDYTDRSDADVIHDPKESYLSHLIPLDEITYYLRKL